MSSKIPRILVVGGGAGGLELVTTLGKTVGKKGLAKLYLSDGSPTHIWKPLLHEVATGALNVGEDEVNYFTHASQSGYRFHYGWMKGLDRERKVIKTAAIEDLEGNIVSEPREFSYDTLVMAVGGQTNSFGTPGVEQYCYRLDSPLEAERLRKRFLGACLALAFKKIGKIKIGIVGAGPTGVELAAEIHRTLTEIHAYGVDITEKCVEMTIIEAGPTLLPGTAPHIQEFAKTELSKRGVQILTNCAIKEIDETGFRMADGSRLEKSIKIWTAGIKAPEWLAQTGLDVDRINRIRVNKFLQSVDDPSIFAIGDCSTVVDPKDPTKIIPATAQCAHQQAEWLAQKIRNDILGKPTKAPFDFNSKGMLVSLGHTTAVGTVSGLITKSDFHLRGRSAKFLYSTLYRMHQAAVYGRLNAFCIYVGDRLRGYTLPKVKLH